MVGPSPVPRGGSQPRAQQEVTPSLQATTTLPQNLGSGLGQKDP